MKKRKPAIIVEVLVNYSITHASAQRTARHHAGGPVEPFDAKLHDVSESERVTVRGLAMPDGMCSFVSVPPVWPSIEVRDAIIEGILDRLEERDRDAS